jgi:hypothetical protein
MGVAMGTNGVVNGANTVRKWTVDYIEDDRPYAATNTAAGTDRNCGIVDWTGQYSAYGGTPITFPGDALSFIGAGIATDGASGTAICERLQVAFDQENVDYCQHLVHFGGNGALTLGTIAPQSDATIPDLYCGGGMILKADGDEVPDVRRGSLDFMRMHGIPPGQIGNRPYSSSSTPGAIRRVKSRLDWRGFFDMYVATYQALDDLFAVQTAYNWQFYVNATQYWDLNWGRIVRFEKLGADVEGSELLGVRVHIAMKGNSGTSRGYVKSPGNVSRWP